MATKREAERAARKAFPGHVITSVTEEDARARGRKAWSFGALEAGATEDDDHEYTGYVREDGAVEGLY